MLWTYPGITCCRISALQPWCTCQSLNHRSLLARYEGRRGTWNIYARLSSHVLIFRSFVGNCSEIWSQPPSSAKGLCHPPVSIPTVSTRISWDGIRGFIHYTWPYTVMPSHNILALGFANPWISTHYNAEWHDASSNPFGGCFAIPWLRLDCKASNPSESVWWWHVMACARTMGCHGQWWWVGLFHVGSYCFLQMKLANLLRRVA